ncbi:MAG: SDR family oxidoreductase [Thermoanaerobaculia bacterium]|jgi:putative NADH-flavin reductase
MTITLWFLAYAIILSAALAQAGYRSQNVDSESAPHSRPVRVLIVGATGGTGRQLVAQALERGYKVTAFVRSPSRLQIDHPRLAVLQGDVLDAASVEAAMRGQEAVFCALGHKRFFYPTRILSQGTRNILQAMETHNVRRFVCETSLGIGDSAGRMGLYYTLFTIPVILPFYFWDKTRQERLIAESDLEWVIVRPGALNNADKRGQVRHGQHVGNFLWTVRISRADVADFMLNQVESDTYLRSAPGIAWESR